MPKTILKIEAVLEIDSRDEGKIEAWRIEDLQGKIWELLEVSAPVSFSRGDVLIRGNVRFAQPTPSELKVARIKNEEEA